MVKKVVWYVILFIVVQYVALALVTVGNILINGKDAEMGTPQMLLMQGIFCVFVLFFTRLFVPLPLQSLL